MDLNIIFKTLQAHLVAKMLFYEFDKFVRLKFVGALDLNIVTADRDYAASLLVVYYYHDQIDRIRTNQIKRSVVKGSEFMG